MLIAFNIAVLYALPPRQLIFTLALAVGGVLLLSINWHWIRTRPKLPQQPQLPSGVPPLLSAGEKREGTPQPVATLQQNIATPVVPNVQKDEKLTPDEAREWLDDFLVKQQQK